VVQIELEKETNAVTLLGYERVKPSMSPMELDKKINTTLARIKREETTRGKREEIIRDFHTKKKRWDDINTAVRNLELTAIKIEAAHEKRKKDFAVFQKLIGLRAQVEAPPSLSLSLMQKKMFFLKKKISLTFPRSISSTS
jgi:hypothetical protein